MAACNMTMMMMMTAPGNSPNDTPAASMQKAKSNVKNAQKALAAMMAGNQGANLSQVNGNITLAANEMGAMMMMGNAMMSCKRDQPSDDVCHVCCMSMAQKMQTDAKSMGNACSST
ncbi:hypothetical protein EDB86DRAFT_3080242 [Lactarius hatsudake]|nr:hypothetical protein EDB86DRAFT_3080242 [Lactarius hatsudake]